MNNKVIYNRGDIVCDSVTNIDGSLVIDNLHLGSYCLIDRNTSEEKCFILESDDNKTKIVEKDFEFVKRPVKGEIIINNFSNNGDVIVGSVFEILDKNDIVIFNGITNDEGVVKVSDIIFDNYCIRQKVVPSNYVKDSNNICFVLDGIKEVDVINDIIINDTIVVPDTFSDDIGFYEFFVILLMMGIGVVVYKKIFASRL